VLVGRKDNKRGISYQVLIQSEQGAKVLQVPEWRVRPSDEVQHALDEEAAHNVGIGHA
jgi:uroporphyrinogen-III synthase